MMSSFFRRMLTGLKLLQGVHAVVVVNEVVVGDVVVSFFVFSNRHFTAD